MASDWKIRYASQITDADTAVRVIQSGHRLYMSGNCSVPEVLIEALVRRAPTLHGVTLDHVLTIGPSNYVAEGLRDHLRVNVLFIGENVRAAVNDGRADFTPIFLSEVPLLYSRGIYPLDVLLLAVSPPDEHGYVSMGIEAGMVHAASRHAKVIIAEVNERMPRVLGDTFLHVSKIQHLVPVSHELACLSMGEPSDLSMRIAGYIAPLIEDGSTLQAGIGEIPNAVLKALRDKRDLGVHSELLADGFMELAEAGVVTNAKKSIHAGKIIGGFMLGTRRMYDFVHDNPFVELHPTEYVNDPFVIAQNNKMVAINSAVEVDLTGQVCADSIGTRFYSGVGGQVDFIYGASRSEGGQAIIALPSTASLRDGTRLSKIVPTLKPGAGVTTTRNHVHTVVTEYGAAPLYGRSIRERARALIDIAHPDFRADLERQAGELYHL